MKFAGTQITDEQYAQLEKLAIKKNIPIEELCGRIFEAGVAEAEKEPCTCWQKVNTKLTPMGVKLSEKLRTFSPTAELDLKLVHQLPTEPLGAGKFKASMPRYIGFPRCPFCGQSYES
jgi:hypothetical protein